jgi:hypothetical protein
VIDEARLRDLAVDPTPTPDPRPVDDVLARGTRLRRRRRAAWLAAPAITLVGIAAGAIVVGTQRGSGNEVDTATGPSASPTQAQDAPLERCRTYRPGSIDPIAVTPGEVPDERRLIPIQLPGGAAITAAAGQRVEVPAEDLACEAPLEPALVLQAEAADGSIAAGIRLDGPAAAPEPEYNPISRSVTTVRGGEATLLDPTTDDDLALRWTGPDGWTWQVTGYGPAADEAALRTVAEGLDLDPTPGPDEPRAGLDGPAVPAGFDVTWQSRGPGVTVPPVTTTWLVTMVESGASSTPPCELSVDQDLIDEPFGATAALAGTRFVQVGGRPAMQRQSSVQGIFVMWEPSPGVIAVVSCGNVAGGNSAEFALQIAESVEAVPADDPRLLTG